jgi:O-succinylbenzoic acid--CoA ligase
MRVRFSAAPWHSGEGPAALAGGQCWSYDQLGAAAAGRSALLRDQGLTPGELVLVPTDPPLELVLMQHALARCNAALLPVSHDLYGRRRADLAALTGAEWAWSPEVPGRLIALGQAEAKSTARSWRTDPLALVIATSGSSGDPKAAMLTQRHVLASSAQVNARLSLVPGDLWLCCLPCHHIGGLAIAYRSALAGAAVLLYQGFDAAAVAADLARRPVTHISLVPPMLARLLDLGVEPPPSLRVTLVGGEALSTALGQRALDVGWPLCLTYGMTETCSQVATTEILREVPAPGVAGAPLQGLDLDCPGCDETPGILRLRGDLVMAGYANPSRAPGLGLDGGWLTTADLVCRTAAGALRVLGRGDEALVIGGEQVFPALVAQRLMGAPGVESAVVVGVPDPVWGHRLVGVYAGAVEPADLAAWCRGHLSSPERPRALRRLGALPLLPSGKHDLQRIRGLVCS